MDIREFVFKLRDSFFANIEGFLSSDGTNELFVRQMFERSVNDTLLGSAPKPAPRRKRRTKAEIAATQAAEE